MSQLCTHAAQLNCPNLHSHLARTAALMPLLIALEQRYIKSFPLTIQMCMAHTTPVPPQIQKKQLDCSINYLSIIFSMLILLIALPILWATAAPVVNTSYGTVSGASTAKGDMFLGIPFARPPTGDLRWHAPLPPHRWAGTREALIFGPDCAAA